MSEPEQAPADKDEGKKSDPMTRIWILVAAAGLFFFLWLIFRSRS